MSASPRPHWPFVPARHLASPHAQTIWPMLARTPPPLPLSPELWDVSGGDLVEVDLLPTRPGAPGVVVLHGLEGGTETPYVRGLLAAVRARGWNGAAFSFRSCGHIEARGRRLYHSGHTDDLALVVSRLSARWPGSPLGAVGYSLGGNVLCKWLGEQGARAPLAAAVAVSVPFDLRSCAAALDAAGLWPTIYRERFLRSLRRKALLYARAAIELDVTRMRACRTFAEYDDLVTAPLFGFANAIDYWARSSSAGFLTGITTPTLLIQSLDDPFVPREALPVETIAANPRLTFALTEQGGHVGFVAGTPWRPVYAADDWALDFLATRIGAHAGATSSR